MSSREEEESAAALVSRADALLGQQRLNDAERLFAQLLASPAAPAPPAAAACRGLAEIHVRRGRQARGNELEWHRHHLAAVSLQRRAAALDSSAPGAPLEAMYAGALRSRLLPPPGEIKPYKPQPDSARPRLLNSKWLNHLQAHIHNSQAALTTPCSPTLAAPVLPFSTPSTPTSKRKKIDFNRLQKVIMRVVRQISREMRAKHLRRKLPEEVLKRAVSSELLCMLTPQNEDTDMLSLFEESIINEEDEGEGDATDKESSTLSATDHDTSSETDSSVDWRPASSPSTRNGGSARPTSLPAAIPYYMKAKGQIVPDPRPRLAYPTAQCYEPSNSVPVIPSGCPPDLLSPLSPLQPKLPAYRPPVEPAGPIAGVLRIWRGHAPQIKPQPQFAPHLLSFEEMSPLTESARCSFADLAEEELPLLSQRRLDLTLAHMLTTIADGLMTEKEHNHANELFNQALGIYQKYGGSEEHLKAVAHLLEGLATIRCQRGDLEGGSHLLEEAIGLLRREHGTEEHIDVVALWFQLGSAYMSEQCTDSTLLHYIMSTLKEQLEEEAGEEEAVDYRSDSEDGSSGGESYDLNIHEAVGCFTHALQILRALRHKNEIHNEMYVNVLIKLADCSIVMGDYSKSILCYEEALFLFKNIIGSESISGNAHVLSMLGITNLLQKNYPKALRMLQTAHILQQHLCSTQFETAFTLTLIGLIHYLRGHHHKSIVWCFKAYELFTAIITDPKQVGQLKRWFIIQTVYTLGYAYSTLGFHDKSLHYLHLTREMIESASLVEEHTKQLVRVLKLIADVHTAIDDHAAALQYYQMALEHATQMGEESSGGTTLQNQLLNRMAGVHVSTKEYGTAAHYLEQALGCQRNVETSIKGDMVGVMHQLGLTYTLSGDLDKAVDCFQDCIEAYHEIHEEEAGPELAPTLGRLGTLYHVKACLEEDTDAMQELNASAHHHYEEACRCDPNSPVCVQFANYLYQQGHTPDALLAMLDYVWGRVQGDPEITYNGPEQAVLPTHLQLDIDDVDEVALDAGAFGHFLAILCCKELGLAKDADDHLVALTRAVHEAPISINFSILGYALMEMELLTEAAEAFSTAGSLDPDNYNAGTNAWLCMATAAFMVVAKAIYNIWEKAYVPFDETLIVKYVVPQTEKRRERKEPVPPTLKDPRDSGYYDHQEFTDTCRTWSQSESLTSLDQPRAPASPAKPEVDGGYLSSENLRSTSLEYLEGEPDSLQRSQLTVQLVSNQQSLVDENSNVEDEEEVWEYEEETVETPAAILALLQQNQMSDERNGNGHHGQEPQKEVWMSESSVAQPPQVLELLTEADPAKGSALEQTIYDLQSLAGGVTAMDISPEGEPWSEPADIDSLLAQSQSMQEELEESLRSIESHSKRREGHAAGWAVPEGASRRTQEILVSIQNNNGYHSPPPEENGNTAAEEEQGVKRKGALSEYIASKYKKWGQPAKREIEEEPEEEEREEEWQEEWQVWEEVVDTPPEILQALLHSQQV